MFLKELIERLEEILRDYGNLPVNRTRKQMMIEPEDDNLCIGFGGER